MRISTATSLLFFSLLAGCSPGEDSRQNAGPGTAATVATRESAIAPTTATDKTALTPEQIQLDDVPGYPGMRAATLFGRSDKPGMFVLRMKFPPNYVLGPHTHSDDRSFTVLSGTWHSAYGETADCSKATALPQGSFSTIPANAIHFDCTGADGAVIQLTGLGPSGTTQWLNAADDPKVKYAR